jgi:hypothetical protein
MGELPQEFGEVIQLDIDAIASTPRGEGGLAQCFWNQMDAERRRCQRLADGQAHPLDRHRAFRDEEAAQRRRHADGDTPLATPLADLQDRPGAIDMA